MAEDWPELDDDEATTESSSQATKDESTSTPKSGKRAKPRGTPKGSRVAEGPGAKLARKGGWLFEPVSPGACRQAVFWGHQGLAVAVASEEQLHESDPDIEAAGDSLYYLSGMFKPARALVHLAPALVFLGAEASLLRRIFAACPEGTVGWRLSHRAGPDQQQDWQPTVIGSPYAQAS